MISGETATHPKRSEGTAEFNAAIAELVPLIEAAAPGVPNARWIAIRLLDGDDRVERALENRRARGARHQTARSGRALQPEDCAAGGSVSTESNALPLTGLRVPAREPKPGSAPDPEPVIRRAEQLRQGLTGNFRDEAVSSIYTEAERLSRRAVRHTGDRTQARPGSAHRPHRHVPDLRPAADARASSPSCSG